MLQGQLDRLHLGDLLQWLQMGSLTGRLTLIERERERRLDILEGRVVYVSSTVSEERLATWLANEGLLPAARLRHLLGVSLLRRQLFTELLVQDGGVGADVIRSSLNRLAQAVTTRVLKAQRVRFVFDSTFPVRDLMCLDLDVDPHALILEAARRGDEESWPADDGVDPELPFTGEAFERFFWDVIREGVGPGDGLEGARLAELHGLIRSIVSTLAQWLASSPGLVPLPAGQAAEIAGQIGRDEAVDLMGLPHAAWNQMVLAQSVRSPDLVTPTGLSELSEVAAAIDLWVEMTTSERWRRPQVDRLDRLTRHVIETWCRGATAAASVLGIDPEEVALAVHLLVVPTDLVLWVLSTLPVPHQRVRQTLLRRLPQRIGAGLARLADLPGGTAELFEAREVTRLGIALHLGREHVPSAAAWPRTLPDDESRLVEVASPADVARAAAASSDAFQIPAPTDAASG